MKVEGLNKTWLKAIIKKEAKTWKERKENPNVRNK